MKCKIFFERFAIVVQKYYNRHMAKKVSLGKRLLFLLLTIILSPILLIEGIISSAKKRKAKEEWKSKELEGQKLLLSSSITDIDLMEGYMFEDYLKLLFFYLGYKVEQTQKSRDYGADLILVNPQNKKRIIVQAKRYGKAVGCKAVQEILTAKLHYKANDAWVVSNQTFTYQAEVLARENNVRLIDRQELIELYTKVCRELEVAVQDGTLASESASLKEKYPYYI